LARRRRAPARILGWTDEIPALLLTHHAVVSKAGGATTQEALAARCPMIVNQVVPGQEQGNCELLLRHGIGARAETPGKVIAELSRAFRDNGAVWQQWRRALEPLSRPDAAHSIAAALFSHLASMEEPIPVPFRIRAEYPMPRASPA
ncbi:MAG: MGDG synthase family glycosyltransferase, partial [Opitutaceae bacterium]